MKEMSDSFTGIALEIWPSVNFKTKKRNRELNISMLISSISGIRKSLFLFFILSMIAEFISILTPIGIQIVMDDVIPNNDHDLLVTVCLSLMVLYVFQSCISLLRDRSLLSINTLTEIQWKEGLFKHLIKLPLSWFEKRHIGDIKSKFESIDVIRSTFTNNICSILINFILASISLFFLIYYGGYLSTVVFFFSLLYAGVRISTYPIYEYKTEESLILNSSANSNFVESLRSIETIRAQGLDEVRCAGFINKMVQVINNNYNLRKFDSNLFSINSSLVGIDNIIIVFLCASSVMNNNMTIGSFIAFNTLRAFFSESISSIVIMALQIKILGVHCDRVSDIVTNEIKNEKDFFYSNDGSGLSLEVEKLSFKYDSLSNYILEGISFKIKKGESVVIVGESGAGKSTLMKILCGLYSPSGGSVKIGNIEVSEQNIFSVRKLFACVLQEDNLLSGSIRDNITGFDQSPDYNFMISCAIKANIHEFISKLPMGYDTLVGELGEGISGGHRQRVFIARALYKKPGILFMDEATSHLDDFNQKVINEAITSLNITRVIIAHRKSTIESADRIIEIKKNVKLTIMMFYVIFNFSNSERLM